MSDLMTDSEDGLIAAFNAYHRYIRLQLHGTGSCLRDRILRGAWRCAADTEAMDSHVAECGDLFASKASLNQDEQQALLARLKLRRRTRPRWRDITANDRVIVSASNAGPDHAG